MSYEETTQKLLKRGYARVERDDRLFDVLPHLQRKHGLEVWEKWTARTVQLALIPFQVPKPKLQRLRISRSRLEVALRKNQLISQDSQKHPRKRKTPNELSH